MTDLTFHLSDVEDGGELLPTTCDLSVSVGGTNIWPVRGDEESALEIEVDDLLSHLAEAWKPLILRQTYPGTFNPMRPSLLLPEAASLWGKLPQDLAAAEDETVEAFADVHNLSRCFAGLFDLPSLWLVRSGNAMLVDTGEIFERVDIDAAVAGLTAVGDEIAGRLEKAGDDQWSLLIESWRRREEGGEIAMASWSTSLVNEDVIALAKEGLLPLPKGFAEAANDRDVFSIAARMASALPLEEIRNILERVRVFQKATSPALDQLAEAARASLAGPLSDALPYEQGEGLANMLRRDQALPNGKAVNVFALVEKLGIPLQVEDVETPGLDALAIWGDRHGPAILLNETSERHKSPFDPRENFALRITLAHELCHLLADSTHVLSAIDVLNSRMPQTIEQRARAFAAELLLPTSDAARAWIDADRPRDRERVDSLLDTLSQTYKMSRAAASWKLQHGARRYGINLNAVLDVIVPYR